jgi:DNA-binding transcriptional LysR family regulator
VQRRVYERRFVVASSADHPRRRLSRESFAAADHLLVAPEGTPRGFVDDYLAQLGLRRRVAVTVTSFTTAARVVSRTALLATLPEEVVRNAGVPLVAARLPLEVPALPMLLLWLPRLTTDAKHRFVRHVVEGAVRSVTRSRGGASAQGS